jgi:hypothetical protein
MFWVWSIFPTYILCTYSFPFCGLYVFWCTCFRCGSHIVKRPFLVLFSSVTCGAILVQHSPPLLYTQHIPPHLSSTHSTALPTSPLHTTPYISPMFHVCTFICVQYGHHRLAVTPVFMSYLEVAFEIMMLSCSTYVCHPVPHCSTDSLG